MKVTIIHLDLGIGGAEQLIVSIAKNLQDLGHEVTILTSHHDVKHCFEETKPDGCLGSSVHVYGDWMPRHIFADLVFIDGVSAPIPLLRLFGIKVLFYCHFPDMLLCTDRKSILKRYYRVAIDAVEEWTTGCANLILVNSEFTAGMFKQAFTKLGKQVTPSVLYPVVSEIPPTEIAEIQDGLMEHIPYTHGYDHVFVSLNRYERKKNIFLAIDAAAHLKTKLEDTSPEQQKQQQKQQQKKKKDAHTADENASTVDRMKTAQRVLLVVAGGYDLRVAENVEYLQELIAHCQSVGMPHKYIQPKDRLHTTENTHNNDNENDSDIDSDSINTANIKSLDAVVVTAVDVVFRTSISSTERTALLITATGLLYTPDQEHFGIVPLEAMYLRTPVIAVNSGGPRETVVDGTTGYLCKQTAVEFGDAMFKLMQNSGGSNCNFSKNNGSNVLTFTGDEKTNTSSSSSSSGGGESRSSNSMGGVAHEHVKAKFTNAAMKVKLQEYILKAVKG